MVQCFVGDKLTLNSKVNPYYVLIFTGEKYELQLAGSGKRVARYDRCFIVIEREGFQEDSLTHP